MKEKSNEKATTFDEKQEITNDEQERTNTKYTNEKESLVQNRFNIFKVLFPHIKQISFDSIEEI